MDLTIDSFKGRYNIGDIVLLYPGQSPLCSPPDEIISAGFVKIRTKLEVILTQENSTPPRLPIGWCYGIGENSPIIYICDDMIEFSLPGNENFYIEDPEIIRPKIRIEV